jgi:hypothetical protein
VKSGHRLEISESSLFHWQAAALFLFICDFWAIGLRPIFMLFHLKNWGESDMVNLLDVEVWGSGIIVTLPGTNYWVTYFKEKDSPGLFPADIANRDDPRVTMTAAEFLAKAWKLANERARELGWVT